MFLRRWLSFVAILGVLMHAGLFVHHNAVMLGAALDGAALAEAFGEICHGRLGSPQSVDPALPLSPDSVGCHCPDCLGSGGINAVLPSAPSFYLIFSLVKSDTRFRTARMALTDFALWPPGQGPPLRA
jgi:hypothetical protein